MFFFLSRLSPANLVRALSVAEKFLAPNKEAKEMSASLKKAFLSGHPATKLALETFSSLSKQCKKKFVENFVINAAVLGVQKRVALEHKNRFGLPGFFVISPTAKCNLNCIGCYAAEYAKSEGLAWEEVDRILKEAKDLGIYFITISGGEPFVWPHLFRMLETHNDMYFQIYTNGTLITKDVAKRLAEAGNAAPGISVEGFESETTQRRGEGTFQKVLQAMQNLREAGVLFGFSATCTANNIETLMSDEFVDFYIKQGCRFGWYFQYVPIGKEPDTSLMASPEQRNRLRLKVREFRGNKPIFIGDFWNDGPYVEGCMAGGRSGGYFHINANGNVEPCVFLQFYVDNIKGKTILEVLKSPFFEALRQAAPYCENKNLLSPCCLIDNPWVLREVIQKNKAKPSYQGGEKLLNDANLIASLDKYAQDYKKIVDPVWEKEKDSYPRRPWPDRWQQRLKKDKS